MTGVQTCALPIYYIPSNNRSQLEETAHNKLVVDAYNANPSMPVRLMVSSTVVFQSSQPVTSMLAILLSQV